MNADDGRRNVLTVTKPLASERSYSRGGTAGAATKRHGRAGEATAGAARQGRDARLRERGNSWFEEDAHRKCSL